MSKGITSKKDNSKQQKSQKCKIALYGWQVKRTAGAGWHGVAMRWSVRQMKIQLVEAELLFSLGLVNISYEFGLTFLFFLFVA